MSGEDTRDIAVGANVKVDAHIDDCIRFRTMIAQSFKDMNENMSAIGDQVKALQIRAALAVGGLVVLGKTIDYILQWHGK